MEAKGSPASSASSSSSSPPSGRPVKGILKNPSGGTAGGLAGWGSPSAPPPQPPPPPAPPRRRTPEETPSEGKKSQKWDEMNILATYHPAGKDYGLMKIDEPSTPYHRLSGDDEDAGSDTEISDVPTADVLAKKLTAAAEGQGPRILARQEESSDEDEDDAELTPEELEKKKQFEMKRKMHYNEAQNIKLARKLIAKELHGEAAEDDEGDEEDDDDEEMQDVGKMSPELVPAPPSDPLENTAHSLEEACPGL